MALDLPVLVVAQALAVVPVLSALVAAQALAVVRVLSALVATQALAVAPVVQLEQHFFASLPLLSIFFGALVLLSEAPLSLSAQLMPHHLFLEPC
ncbi:hypothetical protein FHQ21_04710 [Testudinibacter aquarius]|uniref:Uncharacterized protein n=1 Tax=Testudinibacter aquarius TaxID=1524974 RepID=A0ABY2XWL0_9PAST|nr:hypothetical protein FHQ21_04710 [Testudinibacter aquarius]